MASLEDQFEEKLIEKFCPLKYQYREDITIHAI
jgi:hypothetical protein